MSEFYRQKGSDEPWTIIQFTNISEIYVDGIPMVKGPGDRLAFSKSGKFKFMNERQFQANFELEAIANS